MGFIAQSTSSSSSARTYKPPPLPSSSQMDFNCESDSIGEEFEEYSCESESNRTSISRMANTNRRLHQQREPTWRKFGNALGSLLSAAAVPGVVTACRTGMRITDIGFLGNFHAPAQAQSTQFFYSTLPFQNMTSPSSSSSSSSVSAATFSTKHLAAAGFTGTWFEILWFFLVNGCVSALKEIGSTRAQGTKLSFAERFVGDCSDNIDHDSCRRWRPADVLFRKHVVVDHGIRSKHACTGATVQSYHNDWLVSLRME